MTRPIMSGHCSTADRTPNPGKAHARCSTPQCTCPCHVPPNEAVGAFTIARDQVGVAETALALDVTMRDAGLPVPKLRVGFKCLTGNHAACTGRHPGGSGAVNESPCGCPDPSHAAELDTATTIEDITPSPAAAMGRAIAEAEERRVVQDLRDAAVPFGPDAEHNCGFTRDPDAPDDLVCACGGRIHAGVFTPGETPVDDDEKRRGLVLLEDGDTVVAGTLTGGTLTVDAFIQSPDARARVAELEWREQHPETIGDRMLSMPTVTADASIAPGRVEVRSSDTGDVLAVIQSDGSGSFETTAVPLEPLEEVARRWPDVPYDGDLTELERADLARAWYARDFPAALAVVDRIIATRSPHA